MRNCCSAILVVCVATACGGQSVTVGSLESVMVVPAIPNRDVDILFVIDNSPSMADKQASLRASFPGMMDALGTLEGGLPNLHIGVVTSDLGMVGSLDPAPGPPVGSGPGQCSDVGDDGQLQHASAALGSALYIEDVANADGTRSRNYTGELRDVFAEIANVGDSGCGFEQHLASMRRALENSANGDFLRPNANLAVIVVADEDDCSMTHSALVSADTSDPALGPLESFRCTRFGIACDDGGVSTDDMNTIGTKDACHSRTDSAFVEDTGSFVSFLDGIKPDPHMVMVAAIAGDRVPVQTELRPPPGESSPIAALGHSCSYDAPDGLEVADPAVRLGELVDAFPGRGTFESVCNNDLTVSLSDIGYATKRMMGEACLPSELVDTSAQPGPQPTCIVTDGDTTIPPCDDTNLDDCWQFAVDAQRCPSTPDNLRFEVVRSAPPMTQSFIELRCLVARH